MSKLKLYRRRFIPNELVELKSDEILRFDNDVLVTRWRTIKPRKDFTHGQSVLFLKKGWKISRFLDARDICVYNYCDIGEAQYNEQDNSILFCDLLVDVIVFENGDVKVVDAGEIADALASGLITADMAMKALRRLDDLLCLIYAGHFHELLAYLPIERRALTGAI